MAENADPVTRPTRRSGPATAHDVVPGRGFSRPLAVLVAATYFMEIFDGTVIAPAAPAIARNFGVQPEQINLVLTAYLLTVATFIPASGWLADKVGVGKTFVSAVTVFSLASAACAAARSLDMLVAARIAQGVGGALMVPVGRLAVLRTSTRAAFLPAIAYLTWPALLAPVLAPTVGGVLATYASWRWIFLINVPLGAVGALVAVRLMPRGRGDYRPLDWPGLLLNAAAATALVAGLGEIGRDSPGRLAGGLGLLAAAALLVVIAVRHLRRAAHPLLELDTLRIATLRATAAGGAVFRLVIYAQPFLLPLYFVLGFGWSPARAGLILIALFAGNVGIKPLTTPLLRRWRVRAVLIAAVAVSAMCLTGLAVVSHWPPPLLIATLTLSGMSRSVGFTAYNAMAFADVPPNRLTAANTINAYVGELAGGLGVAVGAAVLSAVTRVATAQADGYRLTFAILAVLLVAPFLEALNLPAAAATSVTDRTRATPAASRMT